MEKRKIAGICLAMFLFAGVAIASLLPTANSAVEITKQEETAIKAWFTQMEGNIDDNFTVGELICSTDTNSCRAHIHKEGLVNTDVMIPYTGNETMQELADTRDAAIEARLKGIAATAAQRLARQEEAKVGEGDVTVNVK